MLKPSTKICLLVGNLNRQLTPDVRKLLAKEIRGYRNIGGKVVPNIGFLPQWSKATAY